jgi:tetratricopeptide (TPR) repeat protein
MDTIQELKQRASTLEANGDDSGALKVYSTIPADKLEAGILGRMAAVQVRVGRISDAVKSHERAAAMLTREGLVNAAIFAYRQLLQVEPQHTEALLSLGQLCGEAGYTRDAVDAFSSFLEAASGEDRVESLVAVLEELPPPHRASIASALREPLLERAVGEDRLDAMLEGGDAGWSGPSAGAKGATPSGASIGLVPTGLDESTVAEPDIAPLEGLETHGPVTTDLPPILGDLPLLDPAGGGDDHDDVGAAPDSAAALPGLIPTLDDLDTFHPDAGDEVAADEDEEDVAGDLPLIGFDAAPAVDHRQAEAAGQREQEPESGSASSEEWVDLGAMVLGEDDAAESGTSKRGSGGTIGDEEDFSGLLEQLGARAPEEGEDVGSHYDLGLAYKEMGLMDAAVAQLHDALAAGDQPLASLEVLGECYMERGELDRASTVLERATQLRSASDSDLIGVRYLLGRCAEAMGEKEAARESYARVISMEPRFRDAAARLERL